MAATIVPILTIALQAEPELLALVQSLLALKKKYPTLAPAQLLAAVQQIVQPADAEFDAVLQKVAADQAAHPAAPAAPLPPPARSVE